MFSPGKKTFHLLFILTIFALAAFKWQDFKLPYFWDELGVYSQAADYQYHHEVSLMPASVPPVLSRGHPLLFTAMMASAMRVLGEHILSMHLFCFSISILLLLTVYLKISKYFDTLTGFLSALILAIQPLFLAQSCLMLPEISLALFILLALCNYYENKFLLFAVFSSLAILTKESVIVLPVAVLIYSVARWVVTRVRPAGLSLRGFIATCTPYIVFALFLCIQKRQNGWYFFPYHLESVSYSISGFIEQFKLYAIFIFKEQGRYVISAILLAGLFTYFILKRSKGRNFVFLIAILALLFLILNSLFTVYMARYIMPSLVVVCILAGLALASLSRNKWFITAVIGLLSFVSYRHWDDGWFHYDADLGYRRGVNVVQQAVSYTLNQLKPGDKIDANFPAYFALSFPEGGYLNGHTLDKKRLDDHGDHYLLICEPGPEFQNDSTVYQITFLKKFDDGPQHVTLYWRQLKIKAP